MHSEMSSREQLHIKTPLVRSERLSTLLKHHVYVKMESKQVSGSFKMRGISHHSLKSVQRGCKKLIGASGGNAGIAVAHAAKMLNVPCAVYMPESTSKRSIELINAQGAEVIVQGENYSIALKGAKKESEEPGNSLIDSYDHPEIWEGHSTIILEIQEQLNKKPSIIIVPVGGGGLLCGVLQGIERIGWSDVPVLTMETFGAHCFNMSFKAKKIVPLENITSIATTLGARTIPQYLLDILPKFKIISQVVTDTQAVSSCLQFAVDEDTIVEPSCGATLAAIYCNILQKLIEEEQLQLTDGPAVVIASGGSGATLEMLQNLAIQMNIPKEANNSQ